MDHLNSNSNCGKFGNPPAVTFVRQPDTFNSKPTIWSIIKVNLKQFAWFAAASLVMWVLVLVALSVMVTV